MTNLTDAQLQSLVRDFEISAAVFGKGEEFVLVPLNEEDTSALTEVALARSFRLFGVMSFAGGEASSQSQPGVDAVCGMVRAACTFAELVADRVRALNTATDALERGIKEFQGRAS